MIVLPCSQLLISRPSFITHSGQAAAGGLPSVYMFVCTLCPNSTCHVPTMPQAKQQLAQLMWLRQSEDLVLEALSRLALLGEDLLRMLRT